MNKIIYSLKVMEQLVEKGNVPISTMPNPKFPQFSCWIFEVTEKFQGDLDIVLGGQSYGEKQS